MSVKIEPFGFSDLWLMDVQDRHAPIIPLLARRVFSVQRLAEGPWSYTAWNACGVPVACCGIMPGGGAWAFLGADMRRYMTPVTRHVLRVLKDHVALEGPVYADIDMSYPAAIRWAKLLGFRPGAESRWVFN